MSALLLIDLLLEDAIVSELRGIGSVVSLDTLIAESDGFFLQPANLLSKLLLTLIASYWWGLAFTLNSNTNMISTFFMCHSSSLKIYCTNVNTK